ncbi:2-deoxyglucose-6-phosphate hydrolase yniC [Vibrio ishigakensis]|uniref:2-deoxyglucose-6-phosphate hydrolase yniC n=1 Tax=Vibrio ishigakensis TaxID=1481914 RepID=A0A0B8QAQ7_9VIBR|nr:2-deoxyglucose-6-phosphate hydrolase yniC [Vibrio ishigakensis]
MLKAVIFDMDGLMIDSEPFWRQAQLEIFPKYGVSLTEQDTIDTTGVRIDNIVEIYYAKQPWAGTSQFEVCEEISDRVIELIKAHKPAMAGLKSLIRELKTLDVKLAVASSSPMKLIVATLDALDLTNHFDAVQSAEALEYGKPHPEVYINTANALHVSPTECLALEDSLTGLLAAKAARMKTIVVPENAFIDRPQWSIADHKLASLEEVTLDMVKNL